MKALPLIALLLTATSLQAWEPTQSFVDYLKLNEGFRSEPYQCAGGYWHVGYGHNLDASRNPVRSVSREEAERLLRYDIRKSAERVSRRFGTLDNKQLEILVDFDFNGCARTHPKFTQAVLNRDMSTMRREYKRYTNGRELQLRNRTFAERYLR